MHTSPCVSPLCPSLYFPSFGSPSFSHLTLCTRPLVSMGTRLERVALLWSRRFFMELCHFFFFLLPPHSFSPPIYLFIPPCLLLGTSVRQLVYGFCGFSTCQATYVPVFSPCRLPLTLWTKCSADQFVFHSPQSHVIWEVTGQTVDICSSSRWTWGGCSLAATEMKSNWTNCWNCGSGNP